MFVAPEILIPKALPLEILFFPGGEILERTVTLLRTLKPSECLLNEWIAERLTGQRDKRPWVETMTRINESTTYVYKIPNWGQDFTGHRILLKEDRRGKRYASFLKWNMISPPTKKGTRNST